MRDMPPGTAPTLEPSPLVAALREVLGARLVAYLAGADSTRVVSAWADGASAVPPGAEGRLRLAHQVAGIITGSTSPRLAQSWFQGMNPHLGDHSPARLIRETDPADSGPVLVAAAHAYAAQG